MLVTCPRCETDSDPIVPLALYLFQDPHGPEAAHAHDDLRFVLMYRCSCSETALFRSLELFFVYYLMCYRGLSVLAWTKDAPPLLEDDAARIADDAAGYLALQGAPLRRNSRMRILGRQQQQRRK